MKIPKLAIIVLQYNKSDYTLACLESLTKLAYPDFDVIVIDNASETAHLKNVEYWIELHKTLGYELLAMNSNLGYSGGNNIGIKHAIRRGADYVLILNNDTVVPSDFLQKMLSAEADIAGAEIKKAFGFEYLDGTALLVKKEVFEKIGHFDERYFLYYEDVEFSMRARKAGLSLKAANTGIQHAVSATTKLLGTPDLLYYHTRNVLLLRNPSLPFGKIWTKLKQHAKIALGRDIEASRAILQGVKDYDQNRFGMRIS